MLDVKFLRDAESGDNVLSLVGVDQQRCLAFDDRGHCDGFEILWCVGLFGVFLCLDQLGTKHRDRLCTRTGRFARTGEAVIAERDHYHRGRNDSRVIDVFAPRFGDHRLPRNKGDG